MNANLIIFLREFRIFSRAFILNVIAIFALALCKITNPLPFLIIIPAIYFSKVNGITIKTFIASILFILLVMPFYQQSTYMFLFLIISLILIIYMEKQYSLRDCSWASWTLGSKLAFCLYINGFNYLMYMAIVWFIIALIKEMKTNTSNRPPYDIIPQKD